ncbi:hypothetical protein WDU94_006336 [Cyamophila willieti]
MPIYPTWAQMRKIRHTKYGKGLIGWWRQGWNEYPENMFGGVHAVLGLGLIGYRINDHLQHGTNIRQYRAEYTVYRSDDKRLAAYKEFYEPNYTSNSHK